MHNDNESPFLFTLTDRGFYSEINNLLNAFLYGLIVKRHLYIDLSMFCKGDLEWSDLYSSQLPLVTESCLHEIEPNWIVESVKSPGFKEIRSVVIQHHIEESVFSLKRTLAKKLCKTTQTVEVEKYFSTPYVAIHIRRGDKVDGYLGGNGILTIEGERNPVEDYLSIIKKQAPDIQHIFVMTDDYTIIDELKAMDHGLEIETFCEPAELGYATTEFRLLESEVKTFAIQRLILETEIAIKSQVFVGCYLSNVSRYIALMHQFPNNCFSVDSEQEWHPL